jgi:type 1 glutamine amidotransferase
MTRIGAAALLTLAACAISPAGTLAAPPKLLVVTVTKGFRHESIPATEKLVERLAQKSGAFTVDFARTDEELVAKLGPKGRDAYAGVLFAQTTGDLPIPDPQGFVDWIAAGHGFVGIHSATDTFPTFAPFIEMIGAHFKHHGPQVKVGVLVKDASHPSTKGIPQPFEVFDEIYQFEQYDPARVHLLLYMSTHPESGAPGEFPLAWTRTHGKGRVFYEALGHREDVLDAEWYGAHLTAGIVWALGASK